MDKCGFRVNKREDTATYNTSGKALGRGRTGISSTGTNDKKRPRAGYECHVLNYQYMG